MSHKPLITKTTHTLPFARLSPLDFERMCLWLILREGYENAEHLGAAGGEQGRDIAAWRAGRRIAFQCKRVERLGPKSAEDEIQKIKSLPEASRPDEVVFLVSTSVGVTARDRARAEWGDEKTCRFWAGSELDEKVKRYADILHEFFDLGSDGVTTLEPTEADETPRYHSTYISYSRTETDRAFAFKLYQRLKAEGVGCWLWDHDPDPGESKLDSSARAIQDADKLLLCCSETSLRSWWVDDELGKAIEKERAQWSQGRGLVLIPLTLDDYLSRWDSGKASQVRERYPADFAGWGGDEEMFEAQVHRLLRALEVDGARGTPP